MREIRFRGRDEDNGEWRYGYYYYDLMLNAHIIVGKIEYIIDPDSLGQYTGLKSMGNAAENLYAGDILKADSPLGNFESDYPGRGIGVIVWDSQEAAWCLEWRDNRGFKMRPLLSDMISKYPCKIGNIHESNLEDLQCPRIEE